MSLVIAVSTCLTSFYTALMSTTMNVHRVDFKTQSSGAEETPLVKAATAVFVNGAPNVWELAVQAVPAFLVPLLRLLSHTFPSQTGLESEEAFATIYGTSDILIEVSYD